MKKLLPLVVFIIVFGCKQDANKGGQGGLQLTCEDIGSVGDIYKNAIYAVVDERKTKILEIHSACMEVEPKSYASYGIPADAAAVAGSWFAGLGEFVYAKKEGDKFVFYYSAIGEEIPVGGIKYHQIAIYEAGKITVNELQ